MKSFAFMLVLGIGASLVLFTNCGKSPGQTYTTVNNSVGDDTNDDNDGAIYDDDEDSSDANFDAGTLPKLSDSEVIALEATFIPQVGKVKGDHRYSTALFGLAHEMAVYGVLKTSYQKIYVSTTKLAKGSGYPAQIHKSSKAKAPLAILLNPLYSDELSGQMNRLMDFFAKKDYHVIAFANPWAPEVIANAPTWFPGDLWVEAPLHLEMINKVINDRLGGRQNVSGAVLGGLSYGAFMSAVLKAYDQQSGNPLITGPTLIMSPPIDMMNSLKVIDGQVASVSYSDAINCTLNDGFYNIINQVATYDDYNKTNINEKCSKWIFGGVAFQATLMTALFNMNISKNLKLSSSALINPTYDNYTKNIAKIVPEAKKSDIGYWLKTSKDLGYDKFTVVLSVDDNINEGKSLGTNAYYNFNTSSLVQLPTGGHTGFREGRSTDKTCGKDWTECMLKLVFN